MAPITWLLMAVTAGGSPAGLEETPPTDDPVISPATAGLICSTEDWLVWDRFTVDDTAAKRRHHTLYVQRVGGADAWMVHRCPDDFRLLTVLSDGTIALWWPDESRSRFEFVALDGRLKVVPCPELDDKSARVWVAYPEGLIVEQVESLSAGRYQYWFTPMLNLAVKPMRKTYLTLRRQKLKPSQRPQRSGDMVAWITAPEYEKLPWAPFGREQMPFRLEVFDLRKLTDGDWVLPKHLRGEVVLCAGDRKPTMFLACADPADEKEWHVDEPGLPVKPLFTRLPGRAWILAYNDGVSYWVVCDPNNPRNPKHEPELMAIEPGKGHEPNPLATMSLRGYWRQFENDPRWVAAHLFVVARQGLLMWEHDHWRVFPWLSRGVRPQTSPVVDATIAPARIAPRPALNETGPPKR